MQGRHSPTQDAPRKKKTVDPFYSSKAWHKVKSQALKRDGYRCVQCQANVHGKGQSRVDHIIPRKAAPRLALHLPNLRTLCRPCDNARHARDRAAKQAEAAPVGMDGFPVGSDWGE